MKVDIPKKKIKDTGERRIEKPPDSTRRQSVIPPKPKVNFNGSDWRIRRQHVGVRVDNGNEQEHGHYEVHYRQSVFKPFGFAWFKSTKGKSQSDFKDLRIQLINNNEVQLIGTRVIKSGSGEAESKG